MSVKETSILAMSQQHATILMEALTVNAKKVTLVMDSSVPVRINLVMSVSGHDQLNS